MIEKRKSNLNLTLKPKFSLLENKETLYNLPKLKLKLGSPKLNTCLLLLKRENLMLEENLIQLQKERNKKKNNVKVGEVYMLEILNKEQLKLELLDRLNKS